MALMEAAPSARVDTARRRAAERVEQQRRHLRVVGWGLEIAVVIPVLTSRPWARPGAGVLELTGCLAVYTLVLLAPSPRSFVTVEAGSLGAMGAAGVGLGLLGYFTSSSIAVAAAVFLATLRLPRQWALAVGGASTVSLALLFSLKRSVGTENALASVLLCTVLGLVGGLLKQSRVDQERTDVLVAQLEDARDAQAEAATIAERARIARELHDVLAHSLSGLAIQLEGARKLSRRVESSPELQELVDRAATLARSGLSDARRAVDALRGGEMASIEHIDELVAHYRDDFGLPVSLTVSGTTRPLAADVSVVLFRATGEGLANVVRHAPGATASVSLAWEPDEVVLTVANDRADGSAPLAPPGHGWGLSGLAERVALVGGRYSAGPTANGWEVRVTVPA